MKLEDFVDQTNWPSDLAEAKQFAKSSIDLWKFRGKAQEAHDKIDAMANVKDLQFLVVNAIMSGEGLKTI